MYVTLIDIYNIAPNAEFIKDLIMEKIYTILKEIRPEFDFSESEDFVEDGILDSFDLVTLVSELESNYDIKIDGLNIVPENFINVETIAALVRKSGGIV